MRWIFLILVPAIIFAILLALSVNSFEQSGLMRFPKPVHGNFIQSPELVTDGDDQKVTWTLSERCSVNGYEVREIGYMPNSGMFWGGGDAECLQVSEGYKCEAPIHAEMRRDDLAWIVQVSANECDSGEYYVSEAASLERDLINDEYGFQITYPSNLVAFEQKGRSDQMGEFASIDLGTKQELELLRKASNSPGAGGPPLFLRLTVSALDENEDLNCGELTPARNITLDSATGILCEGSSMVSDNMMLAILRAENSEFVFRSDKYSDDNARLIDGMIRSLQVFDE